MSKVTGAPTKTGPAGPNAMGQKSDAAMASHVPNPKGISRIGVQQAVKMAMKQLPNASDSGDDVAIADQVASPGSQEQIEEVVMVDASTAATVGGAGQAEQSSSSTAAPESRGSAAPSDAGGGGIGTMPLILGGLALAGGGVALAAGGGGGSAAKPNTPPQLQSAQAVTTKEDTSVAVSVAATDADGDALTYSASNPTKGTVTGSGGNFTYVPSKDFNGTDSFTVTATDGRGGTATQTVTVTVSAVNDAPTAIADTTKATEDSTAVTGSVATNDGDVDGDTLTYALTNGPVAGLTLATNGGYTFDPANAAYQSLAAGKTQDVVANYTVTDGKGGTASSTLTITVTGVNDAPVAKNVSAPAPEDGALTGTIVATDADAGTVLTYALTTATPGLALNADGSFTFDGTNAAYQDIAVGQTRQVVAGYSVSDGQGGSTNATLTLNVAGVNDAPVVANPIADQSVAEDAAWTYQVPANVFSDVDNAALTLTASLGDGSALPAWLAFNAATRTFSGTPPLNFNGNIDLRVTASDGTASVNDVFRLTVTPVNDAPVVTSGPSASVAENAVASTVIYTATATDVDAGTALRYSLAGVDAGAFQIDAVTGHITLLAPANFEARQSYNLTVQASDGTATASRAVAVAVTNAVDDLSIDGGNALETVTVNARGGVGDLLDVNYRFLESAADENDVLITNFTANDFIEFDSDLSAYNFSNNAGDLVITQNQGGTVSRVVIDDVLSPSLVLLNSSTAANTALNTALGTSGVRYLVGTSLPTQNQAIDVGNGNLVQISAADAAVTFNENAAQANTIEISNFTADDRILVSGAAPGNYTFFFEDRAGGTNLDLVITYNNNGVVSSITLVDIADTTPPPAVLFGATEANIEAFLGFDFFQYA